MTVPSWWRRDCLCGHMWAAHGHYRAGSDCAACDCPRYQAKPRRRWRP